MAVVRIKRRLGDDPIDALLLTSKKLKTDESVQSTVFKFAATIKKDEDVSSVVKQFSQISKYKTSTNLVEKITEKLRAENRLHSSDSRLKVVNLLRNIENEGTSSSLTVVEVEATQEATTDSGTVSSEKLSDTDYVFDLYYTSSLDVCDSSVDSILSAIPVGNELLFDEYRDAEDEECYDCDEDSNDENYFTNDYPDEEDQEEEDGDDDESYSTIDEDDMRRAAHGIRRLIVDSDGGVGGDSSGDEFEDWIYGSPQVPDDKFRQVSSDCSSSSSEQVYWNSMDSDDGSDDERLDHGCNMSD